MRFEDAPLQWFTEGNDHDSTRKTLPPKPGLYAIWADNESSAELGLHDLPESIPLYVGKAEDSVVTRDINTHFCDGRTGSSTVRRSFAALLRERLDLHGMPRYPSKPGYFANYADGKRLRPTFIDPLTAAGLNKPPPIQEAFKSFQ